MILLANTNATDFTRKKLLLIEKIFFWSIKKIKSSNLKFKHPELPKTYSPPLIGYHRPLSVVKTPLIGYLPPLIGCQNAPYRLSLRPLSVVKTPLIGYPFLRSLSI
jgi:hypothetical protein